MDKLKKILLVDDDKNDVELTLSALNEQNLANDVIVAWDGEEALDMLFRRGKYKKIPDGNPSVIFLDLKMLKVGGIEVLRQIRAEIRLAQTSQIGTRPGSDSLADLSDIRSKR